MKKLGIAFLLIAFGGMNMATAQQGRQQQNNTEIKAYFEENILPTVEAEQQNFYKVLTTNELEKIEDLKTQMSFQMDSIRKGNRQANGQNKAGQQKGGQIFQPLFDEALEIADAHPTEKKHFQKTMDDNKDKWIQDLSEMRENNKSGGGKGNSSNRSPMFDHFSDAAWLLLFDKERQNFQQMARKDRNGSGNRGNGKGQGKGNGQAKGGRNVNGIGKQGEGMQNGMGQNKNMNPELRVEIRNYAQANIIPVIAKEREAFDSNLNDTEKDQIALAQGKRKARRIMFREWYKSEDFDPGARRDDPNFDMMREDMQKSMVEIREIAADHSAEINEAMDNIRTYSKIWEAEIKTITDKYQRSQNNNSKGSNRYLQKMASPVNFLLFNYNDVENTALFDIDRENLFGVEVYPNPAISHATIRVTGIQNRQTEVNLFTKEGGLIKTLYNEKVVGEEISFGFSVADLENNIYILKVKTGETVIARKIVVRK